MVKETKNVSITNLPSWEGLESPEEIFTFDLKEQGSHRQDYVSGVLNSMSCQASHVACLLNYDGGKTKEVYSDGAQGRYLVQMQNQSGEDRFVLQVKPSIHVETYRMSDDVFGYLNENDVLAPRLVPFADKTVFSHGGFDVAAVTFRDGTHFDPNDLGQMEVLGEGAARLEKAMKAMPDDLKQRIIDGAKDRNRVVQSGIAYALNDASAGHIRSMVPAMDVERLRRSVRMFQETPLEVCHGDLVQMNVIITVEGDMAILDFDDMNYLPEGIDLGMLAFRVGLDGRRDGSSEHDRDVVHSIIHGYNEEASDAEGISTEYLHDAMELAATYKAILALGMIAEDMKSDLSAEDRFKAHGGKYARGIKRLDALLNRDLGQDNALEL